MTQFLEAITDCELIDLPYVGALFTWWNKRDANPIGNKLDMALIHGEWLQRYLQSYTKFNAGGVSDHARCMVRLSGHLDEAIKPFWFFNFLTDNENFLPTVKEVWDSSPQLYHSRTALSCFHKKLKLLKFSLWALNRSRYGGLPNKTKQAYKELCECQNRVLNDPNPENFTRESEAAARWQILARIEEKFYRQKSCVRWLQAGYQNTILFAVSLHKLGKFPQHLLK